MGTTLAANGDNSSEFPAEVRALLFEMIESYEQLELLLLLRSESKTAWTAEAAAERLGISAESSHAALDHLAEKALVDRTSEAHFRYGPRGPALTHAVNALARAYEEKRLEVMKLMNTNAIERVRTAAIRTFADAFVFRRKDG